MNERDRAVAEAAKVEHPIILAVDFDGTLVDGVFPKIGEDLGGLFYLSQVKAMGCELILWTCRMEERLDAAVAWLDANGYLDLFDAINEHSAGNPFPKPQPRKVYANIYVGDRTLGAPMKEYLDESRRPHYDWKKAGPMLIAQVARILAERAERAK